MRILLDTHILIWAALDRLPAKAVAYFEDEKTELVFSSASIWEIVIKSAQPRGDFTIDPVSFYNNLLLAEYQELAIRSKHTLLVSMLPKIHNDPFDRILIAQSIQEGIPLMTVDSRIVKYPGTIIDVL